MGMDCSNNPKAAIHTQVRLKRSIADKGEAMDNEETLPDSPLVEEQSESEESESHLVKRGKEYGLTPEQSEVLSLYL